MPTSFAIDFKKHWGETTPPRRVEFDSAHSWKVDWDHTSELALSADGYILWQPYGLAAWIESSDNTRESDLALQFQVPGSGHYALSITGGEYAAGTKAAVYIDDKYMGTYDFEGPRNLLVGDTEKLNRDRKSVV